MKSLALRLVNEILAEVFKDEWAPPPPEYLGLELDLGRILRHGWNEVTLQALDALITLLRTGKGPVTEAEFQAMLALLETHLGPGMERLTKKDVLALVGEAYSLGRLQMARATGVTVQWTLTDRRSLKALQDHSVYWVRTYYSRELGEKIANIARETTFTSGLGRMDLAEALASTLADEPFAEGYAYWDVLAAATIQRTRNIGNINGLEAAGAKTYEILAMMDERTCPICGRLDGMKFTVTDGIALRDRLINATSPEDVKDAAPWIAKTAENLAILDSRDSKAIASRGWHLPPFHGRCRCSVIVDEFDDAPPLPPPEPWPKRRKKPGPSVLPSPGNFRTIEDAEAWAREKWPDITWDLSGCHVDTINPTLAQFERLAVEWPEVARRIKYVGTYQRLKPAANPFAQGEYAHAAHDGRLGLNPLWYGNPERFRRSLQLSVSQGFHPPGTDTFESVITHEFGHHVLYMLWLQGAGEAFTDEVAPDGFGLVIDTANLLLQHYAKDAGKLSGYAKTAPQELWAEGFTATKHTPGNKKIKFVKALSAFLDMVNPANNPWRHKWRMIYHVPVEERETVFAKLKELRDKLGIPY